ncbi:4'-phosphopantetheinyl transferase superfamily protein [Polaribacter sp.]|nr:4'-phosphopantetheinyl transferase superfamily protein [Polaribacter sp.]MDB4241616.1 4'-phosphopantetheinyl transferase superfamily protein [Polaribacter sp.]
MIGNDIIDLSLAAIQSNWQRAGFLEKQFTKKEREYILNAADSFLQVWLFWSMKEAAYKCYTQQYQKRFFAPQKFECSMVSKTKGIVVFKGIEFLTTTNFNTLYCHTIAKKSKEHAVIFSSIGLPKTIDYDIKQEVQALTGVLAAEILQKKSCIGAPLYYYKEERITNACSISHHGNYGAFAFTLHNEYERNNI